MKLLYTIVFLFYGQCAVSQIAVNNPIDPRDTPVVQAVAFFKKYLAAFQPAIYPDYRDYWPAQDCQQYHIPDRLLFAVDNEIPTYLLGRPTILYAHPEKDLVHIKTLFSHTDTLGKTLIFAITNHYVKKYANGHFYLENPMNRDTSWHIRQSRNIAYYFPAYHQFDTARAAALIAKTVALEEEWGLKPQLIRYYFADTKMELDQYRGFDFTIAMGNRDKPSGMSDGIDNVIYCSGWEEDYFHEVVHIYLNRLFPGSPLNEGLAVMYGGSLGHDLHWHVVRLNAYLLKHPEIDLSRPADFYYLDNYTNPYYTLLGLLCYTTYKDEGIRGLKQVLRYPTLSAVLSEAYHVPPGGINTFLRTLITSAANDKSAPTK